MVCLDKERVTANDPLKLLVKKGVVSAGVVGYMYSNCRFDQQKKGEHARDVALTKSVSS